ncbi:hypothetical protein RD792_000148 [Penstemon davidsonii]|uniref:Partial AB-hydrolase lipase domain-containing protein n=1 Tax=Penstemon davidsonii TaxID=160366 RepID=A0ABR0DVG5_9LAMI|nr:hypothetical protein RD792_000148 [Penstemon davidsonii]
MKGFSFRIYRGIPRLRASGSGSGSSLANYFTLPQLKRKASNSWSAVQDTYYSTKDIFERHKVVFTVSTSIASVLTAWAGYTIRHYHETRVDQRLESIEKAMKSSYPMEDPEFKKLVSRNVSFPACIATAGTTLIIGRTQLPSNNAKARATLAADDGICSAMVETYNYPCQEHQVTTRDGYILSLQNIPFGQSGKGPGERPPVLLQHGVLMDAITWLLNPPEQSLACLLADNGFDVWLVSTRGTKYSRTHTSLSPDDVAFWDWSWDELAAYDLPATFQYVYDQTGQKLHYVGHSMGTLIGLAAFSKGQLVNMLRSASMLCPIAYVGQMTSPLARIGADNLLAEALYWLNIHEFNPRGDAVIKLLLHMCKEKGIDCTNLLTSFTGQNCCLNSTIVSVFLQHEPQSTSTKNMIHFAQMIREGTIKMYDYGDEKENEKHYGQPSPPSYEMKNIPSNIPLYLAYGGADALSDKEDVKLLIQSLQDHELDKMVLEYREDYAHADYVMAVNVKENVYDSLMAFLRLQ